MFDKLKPAVLTFLHTVIGIKMTSRASISWDNPEVYTEMSQHIVPYCQMLVLMKKLNGIEFLKKWQVVRVRAYKSRTASRHEYFSAAVTNSLNGNTTRYVAIERRGSDPTIPSPPSGSDTAIDLQPN